MTSGSNGCIMMVIYEELGVDTRRSTSVIVFSLLRLSFTFNVSCITQRIRDSLYGKIGSCKLKEVLTTKFSYAIYRSSSAMSAPSLRNYSFYVDCKPPTTSLSSSNSCLSCTISALQVSSSTRSSSSILSASSIFSI